MASVTILKKHITLARRAARKDSTARIDGRSIFIKRYPGSNFKIIMVHVTDKQRAVRDMFAYAVSLAKDDMTRWNRLRHWKRYALKHRKLGAYRAAVSFYYNLIRKNNDTPQVPHHEKFSYQSYTSTVRYSQPTQFNVGSELAPTLPDKQSNLHSLTHLINDIRIQTKTIPKPTNKHIIHLNHIRSATSVFH